MRRCSPLIPSRLPRAAMPPASKRVFAIAFVALLCAMAVVQAQERGKSDGSVNRILLGQVTNRRDSPVPSAIVYLKNTKNLMVKTYIAAADGSYRFPALSPNVDYQVYAEHQGKRSNVKTLSSFDSRREARINLKIDE